MTKTIRSQVVLALAFAMAGAVSFAQSGEATYKARCQSCHGSAGIPNAGIAKLLGVKSVTDPAVKKLTVEEMMAVVKNGKNKMKPIKGLSDAEIKSAVLYYRGLK